MIDSLTLRICKNDMEICNQKIQNLEHAIKQAEIMIAESQLNQDSLVFLKRKIAESAKDLEVLYLLHS